MEVVITQRNSVEAALANHAIPVPELILSDMVVALTPAKSSKEMFWIAKVCSTKSSAPLQYNVRYYQFSKQKKCWVLMKGAGAYGTAPHSSVIAAGLQFNPNFTLTAASRKLIRNNMEEQENSGDEAETTDVSSQNN